MTRLTRSTSSASVFDIAEVKTAKAMEAINGAKEIEVITSNKYLIAPVHEIDYVDNSCNITHSLSTPESPASDGTLSKQMQDSLSSAPSPTPSMHDMISEIMGSYQNALENLTGEVSNLRSELADQKQQLKNNFKVLNQQQKQQEQRIDQQLQGHQQRQQQQQHQLRNQLKQQIETLKIAEVPKLDIQFETIQSPQINKRQSTTNNKRKSKPSKQPGPTNNKVQTTMRQQPTPVFTPVHQPSPVEKEVETQPEAKSTSSKMANAAAGSIPINRNLFTPSPRKQQPRKVDVMLIGDSIVKHVRGRSIKEQSGKYVKVCSFPGAGTEKVCDHTEVELKYGQPESVILHAGSNDLANKISVKEIAENLAYLGCELQDRGVKNIAISGMIPRWRMQTDIPSLNKELRKMCKAYRFDYNENNNIYYNEHIADDCVHLNYDGVDILGKNYARYLKGIRSENKE